MTTTSPDAPGYRTLFAAGEAVAETVRLEVDAERDCPDDAAATPTTQLVAAYTPAPAIATPNEAAITFVRSGARCPRRIHPRSPPPRRGMCVFRKQLSKSTNNLSVCHPGAWRTLSDN